MLKMTLLGAIWRAEPRNAENELPEASWEPFEPRNGKNEPPEGDRERKRETQRKRDRERFIHTCMYVYMHTYVYMSFALLGTEGQLLAVQALGVLVYSRCVLCDWFPLLVFVLFLVGLSRLCVLVYSLGRRGSILLFRPWGGRVFR